MAVAIVVQPARAHAGADILDACFLGDGSKCPIAIVPVQIVASKIVGDVQVWTAGAVDVPPSASEAVSIVLGIQSRRNRTIHKCAIAFVVKQEVWRPVACIEIRRRVMILIEAEIVAVEAEVDVEPSVTVVVRDGSVRERALRSVRKPKGIALELKFPVSLIEKKQRPRCANHKKILAAAVQKVGE